MELVFASNNKNKIREITHILGGSFILLSLEDVRIKEDIPENEPTLEGNALCKARYVFKATGRSAFADDTGLEVDILGGAPGVHSARYAGQNKDSDANIDKLLAAMDGSPDRKARFRTVIALILEGKEFLFEGIAAGTIITRKRGTEGFGYDPVFVPDGETKTFAEMNISEKNSISHRAKAFESLRLFLSSYIGR